MKKRLTFLVALLIAAATSFAAPVMPGFKKTLPTTNGNVITAELQGDEFLSCGRLPTASDILYLMMASVLLMPTLILFNTKPA